MQATQKQFPKPTVTLVVIVASMLVVGYWVYEAPDRGVRPTLPKGNTTTAQQIDARSLVQRIGFVKAPLVKEASALCKSKKHTGIYWTLCDSGNLPFLFAIEASGKLRATVRLEGVQNVDWEALASDEQGRLYVGDIGNNHHLLKKRSIYRIYEPDLPEETKASEPRTVGITARWHYTYPGKPFDAESLVIQENAFWIISKAKHLGETHLYRLAMQPEGTIETLQEAGKLPAELSMIADASLSPDGRHIALVNKYYAAVFSLPNGKVTDICKAKPTMYEFDLFKLEGCAWDGDDLIMITEERKIYRLPLSKQE